MKVKAKQEFKPVTLTITLETQEELSSFYAILNHECVITGTSFGAIELYKAIKDCVGDFDYASEFCKFCNSLSRASEP